MSLKVMAKDAYDKRSNDQTRIWDENLSLLEGVMYTVTGEGFVRFKTADGRTGGGPEPVTDQRFVVFRVDGMFFALVKGGELVAGDTKDLKYHQKRLQVAVLAAAKDYAPVWRLFSELWELGFIVAHDLACNTMSVPASNYSVGLVRDLIDFVESGLEEAEEADLSRGDRVVLTGPIYKGLRAEVVSVEGNLVHIAGSGEEHWVHIKDVTKEVKDELQADL
jgi:hypothetical protein